MMPIAQHEFGALLATIAAKTPAPGGGATACSAGALAAAQAEMVVAYSIGKKDLAAHQETLTAARARLERGRAMLLELGDEDAQAYGLLNELQKLPPGDARREAEMPAAAAACVQIPLAALAVCAEMIRLMTELKPITNQHLRSDLVISAILAEAAARACACNVRVNLPTLGGDTARTATETDRLVATARGAAALMHA